MLTEMVHTDSVGRWHTDKALTLIDISPTVKQFDDDLYQLLSKNAEPNASDAISLKIKKINDDKFTVQQLNADGSAWDMQGQCSRLKE